MHADLKIEEDGDALPDNNGAAAAASSAARYGHSLMDVLRPATPPEPKNARVIRLFDLEAAKYDPKPVAEPTEPAPDTAAADAAKRTRDAEREARRLSLRAAAGLF